MLYTIVRIVVYILGLIGTTFIIPLLTCIFCKEYSVIPAFLIPMISSWALVLIFVLTGKNKKTTLNIRSSFLVVFFAWIFASLFGALPFLISGAIPDFTNAFFESVSGFTTTGATILSDIESLPRSINLWRCQTHWLGGMGIVVLTVALLPLLGIGGFQLIKAETTGPEKGKLTPKITTTAKVLWFIYFAFTVIETVALMIAGMDFIDALSHSFSTLGTGGFSTRNNSIASFNSPAIETICSVFMTFAAINFSMYYLVFKRKWNEIFSNTELKTFFGMLLFAVLAVTLIELKSYGSFFSSLRYAYFQVISIFSTTGFSSCDYTNWKPAAQVIIFALFFIGGCSGSTSGGFKVVRWSILFKQMQNEVKKMLHPHGLFSIRLNKAVGRQDIVFSGAAFVFIYFFIIIITTFLTSLSGLDLMTSFSGAVSMVGNVGPGFNLLGPSYNCGFLAPFVKWWYCIVMIAGRLELYTVFIFLSREYWKK